MDQPVACIVEDAVVCESVFNRDMPVGEDEIVHGLDLQHMAGILDLEFFFVLESENFRFVGGAACGGEVACDGKGLSRVQHTVKHAVRFVSEDALDEVVPPLFAAEPVAVANQTTLAIEDESLRLIENMAAEMLCKIILHPHVVVAGEKVDFNACLMQFVQQVEQSEIAFWDHIAVLKPEVEYVAQKEEVLDLSLVGFQQLKQHVFTLFALLVFRRV